LGSAVFTGAIGLTKRLPLSFCNISGKFIPDSEAAVAPRTYSQGLIAFRIGRCVGFEDARRTFLRQKSFAHVLVPGIRKPARPCSTNAE
jgi:hypothetical protein